MNKYRIYFEPIDVEGDSWYDTTSEDLYHEGLMPDVCKILPIDKDGFPIDL